MTIDEINALPRDAFVDRFGNIVEGNRWIMEEAEARRPFISLLAMHSTMVTVFELADEDRQTQVLSANPMLTDAEGLSDEAAAERTEAGLHDWSDDARAMLRDLDMRYRTRFGWPFVLSIDGHDADGIAEAMRIRMENDPVEERAVALEQVGTIVMRRIDAVIG